MRATGPTLSDMIRMGFPRRNCNSLTTISPRLLSTVIGKLQATCHLPV